MKEVAILGVGSFLPDEVRRNDWWPDEAVRKWTQTAVDSRPRIEDALAKAPTEGQREVLKAMLEVQADPFRGTLERRVMASSMESSGMEVEAARSAIKAAGIRADEVDVLLSYSLVPDDLTIPNGVIIHDKLGLKDECLTTGVEGTCNSFLMQLTLAEQLIATGRASHALLVQSCGISRMMDPFDQQSPWFGDGAAAVVLGAARKGGRIAGRSTITDSRLREAVIIGVQGAKWYEGAGRPRLMAKHHAAAYQILLGFADYGKRVVDAALVDAGLPKKDVTFFACHQAQLWQRRVAQQHCGLDDARSLDTFAWAGNLGSANIPLVLDVAQREGVLRDGDLVAMYGGGAGVTVSGLIAKWER